MYYFVCIYFMKFHHFLICLYLSFLSCLYLSLLFEPSGYVNLYCPFKSQRQISKRRLKNKRRCQLTYGSLLKGQYTFSRTQCVQVTRLTINKLEKIGINKSHNDVIHCTKSQRK